jgi:hypothetical protein
LKRSGLDFTAELVRSDVNVPDLPVYDGPIVAMAGSLMAIWLEAMSFNDLNEFSQRTFQAGHAIARLP